MQGLPFAMAGNGSLRVIVAHDYASDNYEYYWAEDYTPQKANDGIVKIIYVYIDDANSQFQVQKTTTDGFLGDSVEFDVEELQANLHLLKEYEKIDYEQPSREIVRTPAHTVATFKKQYQAWSTVKDELLARRNGAQMAEALIAHQNICEKPETLGCRNEKNVGAVAELMAQIHDLQYKE